YGVQTPIYFKNASAGYYSDFSDIENCISAVLDKVISSGMIYQVNTLGGKITDKEFAAKSAYAHRQYPFLSELQTYWEKPEQQEKYVNAFRDVQKIFSENNIRAQYINYPALEFENYTDAYYGNNYKRLQQVKLKYDEENIFRHAQSITLPE
ncbi:MAG: BBE domain-containing protein, partial [Fimbriimonadaceae bacterium]|nr:BBE domain-containing protein [Chitinophagales bacterium]